LLAILQGIHFRWAVVAFFASSNFFEQMVTLLRRQVTAALPPACNLTWSPDISAK